MEIKNRDRERGRSSKRDTQEHKQIVNINSKIVIRKNKIKSTTT
jgi:hypothetical protein